jgi:hypothetical protein
MTDNDTSFMVVGALDSTSQVDAYPFASHADQFVTIAVVPENSLSDFDLEITDASGAPIARSDSDGAQQLGVFFTPFNVGHYIDFVQLEVAAGQALTARVTARTVDRVFPTYRLIVVGSGAAFVDTDITGAHQTAY